MDSCHTTQLQVHGKAIDEQVDDILSHHETIRDELIPILQEVQVRFGYVPEEAMSRIARFLKVPESMVFGAATFYAQFKREPTGRNMVKVCRGTACHVRGGSRILRDIEKKLGIKPGQTTQDLNYTLETAACFGACALAPVVVFNKRVYGRLTPALVKKALSLNEEDV
jgi:NADH-quinone oxidoreductase subunit E